MSTQLANTESVLAAGTNFGNGRVDDCRDRGNSLHQTVKSEAGCPDTKDSKSHVNDGFQVIAAF